ncbi:type VII secretion integral membrane protein EccD [Mycobacterium neglectum]|uniref:type VII secretion integral membrane protein EccD n=1 Tax=Mycobacterium neglectum TaxID=242737 RepID=UPI00159BD165|nr:type VII secretion integral membrane protein EccD [Mycobacterium neglectum]
MTGVNELREVAVVSAAPDVVRVSVFGGRTQLDVALPADVPVAAFVPELAQLVNAREAKRDDEIADRDDRRTFWVLSRVDGGTELTPEQTLRDAGIIDGELLRISQQRALSPPTLYDDVVDAAARLNRASYAPWDAAAAGVMAIAGLWLCAAAWVYLLVTQALSAQRGVVVGGAVLTIAAMVGGGALARRTLGRADVAAAAALPVVALSGAVGWALTQRVGNVGLAVAAVVLLALVGVYYRVIGTGHAVYVAAAVVYAFGAAALFGSALGVRTEVAAVAVATTAVLGAVVVPMVAAKPGRTGRSTAKRGKPRRKPDDDPFALVDDETSAASLPSAEEVWARVHSAAHTRAGMLAGMSVVVIAAASTLLCAMPSWPALTLALVCAAVLALRSLRVRTVAERVALAGPATALVLIACAQIQSASGSVRVAGVAVLGGAAVVAAVAGISVARDRPPRWLATVTAYLDYAAVAALLPIALWPLGVYDLLGL